MFKLVYTYDLWLFHLHWDGNRFRSLSRGISSRLVCVVLWRNIHTADKRGQIPIPKWLLYPFPEQNPSPSPYVNEPLHTSWSVHTHPFLSFCLLKRTDFPHYHFEKYWLLQAEFALSGSDATSRWLPSTCVHMCIYMRRGHTDPDHQNALRLFGVD